MRVSTLQIHRNGLANMLNNQEQLTKTQQEVSSGVRVNTASDDPIAAARILQIPERNHRWIVSRFLEETHICLQTTFVSVF